jgi:SAM-dependent methyltransferase
MSFLVPERIEPFTYDVVACERCGFLFADNIPSQEAMSRDYAESYKYGYNAAIPKGLEKIHDDIFSEMQGWILKRYPDIERGTLKILDVGCSIGSLLHRFKQAGYLSATGIEPSRHCCAIAKEKYGLSLFQGDVAAYGKREKFHVIMLTGVLEHVEDLHTMLSSIIELLEENGALVIAVPDAGNFSDDPRAPFDEFSLEHVNFFTGQSLSNLLCGFDFAPVHSVHIPAKFYNSNSVIGFFEKHPGIFSRDSVGRTRIESYIRISTAKVASIEAMIDLIIEGDEGIIVWGAGSLTARFLSTTSLGTAKIEAFIDSNQGLWGKKLNGVTIQSPEYVRTTACRRILIGSYIYGKEIQQALGDLYGFEGEILSLGDAIFIDRSSVF